MGPGHGVSVGLWRTGHWHGAEHGWAGDRAKRPLRPVSLQKARTDGGRPGSASGEFKRLAHLEPIGIDAGVRPDEVPQGRSVCRRNLAHGFISTHGVRCRLGWGGRMRRGVLCSACLSRWAWGACLGSRQGSGNGLCNAVGRRGGGRVRSSCLGHWASGRRHLLVWRGCLQTTCLSPFWILFLARMAGLRHSNEQTV